MGHKYLTLVFVQSIQDRTDFYRPFQPQPMHFKSGLSTGLGYIQTTGRQAELFFVLHFCSFDF